MPSAWAERGVVLSCPIPSGARLIALFSLADWIAPRGDEPRYPVRGGLVRQGCWRHAYYYFFRAMRGLPCLLFLLRAAARKKTRAAREQLDITHLP